MNQPSSAQLTESTRTDAGTPGLDEIEREELSRLFCRVVWAACGELSATERGDGGFGHTR